MHRRRMLWQLFPSFVLVVILTAAAIYLYTSRSTQSFYLKQAAADLEVRARLVTSLIAPHLEPLNAPAIDSLTRGLGREAHARLTIVLPDGRVVGDSNEDPQHMERHDTRPEIAEALRGRVGIATRYSNTLQENRLYVAVPILRDSHLIGVVRTSVPTTETHMVGGPLTGNLTADILILSTLIVLLTAAISLMISRSISRPIEELRVGAERFAHGELDYTLPLIGYEETAGLAQAMNQMAAQLHDRINTTVRQRNEQEAILAAMIEGVMAVDSSQNILGLNAAAGRLFKVKPENTIGRSVHEVVRNSDLHRLVSQTLQSETTVEGTIELTGNGERLLQVHGSTLRDARGRRTGGVIVLNDITRLRKLENVRREFVANVSHELRTPITSIKGFLETLHDGAIDNPADARRFLDIIIKHANQLNNIIEDLLALSRLEQGYDGDGIDLTRQPVGRVLRASIQSCENRAAEKNIKLILEGDPELAARVNPNLLEQAVVNLLTNAVTYSPNGSTVRIGARPCDDGLDLYVADQGPGIPPQHQERIFERFYRIDKARSRDQGGTGLGLAIVKHITLAHGGSVKVDSTVGQGSTFTIHLPRP